MESYSEKPVILLIDDTPSHLFTLSRMLSPLYEIVIAKTGEEGLEIIANGGIDLILLDLVMPGISGFDVLEELNTNADANRTSVIFITGSDAVEDEETALALGAVDYIRKPFKESIVKLRVGIHIKLLQQMRLIESFGMIDGLTGVGNRRAFDLSFKQEWNRSLREKASLGMMLLDLDHFKSVNDNYGHLNGDICLKKTADILKKQVHRGGDQVYRWGGEEFVILLPNTSMEGVLLVAEKIRTEIEDSEIELDGITAKLTMSIGVGVIVPSTPANDKVLDGFCTQIDKALYRAKSNGRNRIESVS